MMNEIRLFKALTKVPEDLREPLTEIIEILSEEIGERLTKKHFQEFEKRFEAFSERTEDNFQKAWNSINELAEAQKRTEQRLNELAEAQKKTEQRLNELAEAQKKTEQRLNELAEAQKKTEQRLNELAEAQKKTEQRLNELAEAQKKTEQRLNELAEAQKKTEQRLNELAEAQKKTEQRLNELAEAQKKTEQRLNELAEAQKRTEQRVDDLEKVVAELAEAQRKTEEQIQKLTIGLIQVRKQVGGLARTMAYALENEAFRRLPALLKERYGLEVVERLIRTEFEGREVNIFGKVKVDGEEKYLVGDAVLKLDDREKLKQIWDVVELVKETLGGEVVPIIVTHFAKKDVLERARKAGMIVVQSFEW